MMTLPSGGTTVRSAWGSTTIAQALGEVEPDRAGGLRLAGGDGVDAGRGPPRRRRRRCRAPAPRTPKKKSDRLMPISGRPNAQENSTTVSGVLRKIVTQNVPKARSGGTGETRQAAMSVPSSSEPTSATGDDPQRREEPVDEQVEIVEDGVHVRPSSRVGLVAGRGRPAATGRPRTVVSRSDAGVAARAARGSRCPRSRPRWTPTPRCRRPRCSCSVSLMNSQKATSPLVMPMP